MVAVSEQLREWLITVRTDTVQMPDRSYAERTVVTHPGAVAVLALDDAQRVLMIRQYRHPVGRLLWEIPAGLRFSGLSPDGRLVEFIELPRDMHPFFVATQAHPEFLSRPTRPHPLFNGLIAAALVRARGAETGPRAVATA